MCDARMGGRAAPRAQMWDEDVVARWEVHCIRACTAGKAFFGAGTTAGVSGMWGHIYVVSWRITTPIPSSLGFLFGESRHITYPLSYIHFT